MQLIRQNAQTTMSGMEKRSKNNTPATKGTNAATIGIRTETLFSFSKIFSAVGYIGSSNLTD